MKSFREHSNNINSVVIFYQKMRFSPEKLNTFNLFSLSFMRKNPFKIFNISKTFPISSPELAVAQQPKAKSRSTKHLSSSAPGQFTPNRSSLVLFLCRVSSCATPSLAGEMKNDIWFKITAAEGSNASL